VRADAWCTGEGSMVTSAELLYDWALSDGSHKRTRHPVTFSTLQSNIH
jgi:hypothetical protein